MLNACMAAQDKKPKEVRARRAAPLHSTPYPRAVVPQVNTLNFHLQRLARLSR